MPSPALVNWPSGLPYDPSMDAFTRTSLRDPITSTPEDGPQISRVRSQTVVISIPMALRFDSTQHGTFVAFWLNDLQQGTLHFNMSVMLIGRTMVTRRAFIIGGKYEDRPHGVRWLVSFPMGVFYNPSS